jgi:hypothetical protein
MKRTFNSKISHYGLTNIHDTDLLILYQLDDIYPICITNQYLYDLCTNNDYLKNKFYKQQQIHLRLDRLFKFLKITKHVSIRVLRTTPKIYNNRFAHFKHDFILYIHKNELIINVSPSYHQNVDYSNVLNTQTVINNISYNHLYTLLFNILNEYDDVKIEVVDIYNKDDYT